MKNVGTILRISIKTFSEAQMMCSISPVAVVSCLLLAKWRGKVSRSTFERDCEWLCEKIIAEGGDVVGYQSKKTKGSALVKYAFEKLESCVEVTDEYVSPKESHSSFITLAYNKNSVICRFSIKSVIGSSFFSQKTEFENEISQ